jgi:membrane glycosyltransferase
MVKRKVKKKVSRSKVRVKSSKPSNGKKFNLVLTNLFVFVMLFVASSLLYLVSNNAFYDSVFYLLAILFGFISVAFLITFLVFVFLRVSKK